MTRTILSLWLPTLPTDRLARGHGPVPSVDALAAGAVAANAAPATGGRITVAKVKSAQRIAAVDREAEACGLRPGMALADARAIRPGLLVHEADPAADAALLDDIAAWCSRFTPLVALDGPDGLALDIGGAAHLFGGEAGVMAAAEEGLRQLGLEARAAVAASPEAAWALARFGRVRLAPPPDQPDAVRRVFGPLPLAALRLDPATVRALAQAGLRQIDDLLWRPRAPLAARFGAALFARLDGLTGRLRTSLSPRFDPPPFVAEQRLASPVVLEADIHRILDHLARHLCTLMERQCQGARRVEARLFRVDGAVKRLVVGTSRPLVRPADLARLFRERVAGLGEEGLDTGYGFDLVRLGVLVAEPVAARQDTLLDSGTLAAEADLATLVDRLGARLGPGGVTRLAVRATHIPEQAALAVPAMGHLDPRPHHRSAVAGPSVRPACGETGTGQSDERGASAGPSPIRALDTVSPPGRRAGPSQEPLDRPIRLFARPEPIEAVAAVPDGPPQKFRWRRAVHEIAAIEGPERIAPEWWKADPLALTRDYFRAEDREGRQFWLFREGLLATETPVPRWYVHGLFG